MNWSLLAQEKKIEQWMTPYEHRYLSGILKIVRYNRKLNSSTGYINSSGSGELKQFSHSSCRPWDSKFNWCNSHMKSIQPLKSLYKNISKYLTLLLQIIYGNLSNVCWNSSNIIHLIRTILLEGHVQNKNQILVIIYSSLLNMVQIVLNRETVECQDYLPNLGLLQL